jgi:hypothetical protein
MGELMTEAELDALAKEGEALESAAFDAIDDAIAPVVKRLLRDGCDRTMIAAVLMAQAFDIDEQPPTPEALAKAVTDYVMGRGRYADDEGVP